MKKSFMFHKIKDEKSNGISDGLSISLQNFIYFINHLRVRHKFLSPKNFLKSGEGICITFDDGYKNNIEAIDFLEVNQIEHTIYIANGFINNEIKFWWDELLNLINSLNIVYYNNIAYDTSSKEKKYKTFFLLRNYFINSNNKSLFQVKNTEDSPLTWNEISLISNNKFTNIGSHSYSHLNLKLMSANELANDLERSRSELEHYTKRKINDFAVPFGTKNEYSEKLIALLLQMGCETIALTDFHYTDPKYIMNRVHVSNLNYRQVLSSI